MNEFARFSVHQGAAQRQPGPYGFDLGADAAGGGSKPMSEQRLLELLKRYLAMNGGGDGGDMPMAQAAPLQSQVTPIQWGEEGGKGGGGGGGGFLSKFMGMFGGGGS